MNLNTPASSQSGTMEVDEFMAFVETRPDEEPGQRTLGADRGCCRDDGAGELRAPADRVESV
jgi:hypothetical protein